MEKKPLSCYPEMNCRIVSMLEECPDDPSKLYAAQRIRDLERAVRELQNIARAQPYTWEDPSDFIPWAQARARHALSRIGETEQAAERTEEGDTDVVG